MRPRMLDRADDCPPIDLVLNQIVIEGLRITHAENVTSSLLPLNPIRLLYLILFSLPLDLFAKKQRCLPGRLV